MNKLNTLASNEGYDTVTALIEDFICDGVSPGICMNEDCDYTTTVEPDCSTGWCEFCDSNTVTSAFILAGIY